MSAPVITFTDDTTSLTLPLVSPPLVIGKDNNIVTNRTINNNLLMWASPTKKTVQVNIPVASPSEWESIVGFYDRMLSLRKFPLVSMPDFGISNMPVQFNISDRNLVDINRDVFYTTNIQLTLRETSNDLS